MTPHLPVGGLHRDQRGFITGFVIRLVILFALLGLVVVEGGAIVFARIQAQDVAEGAAVAAAASYRDQRNGRRALEAAEALVTGRDPEARLVRGAFRILQDGSVEVRVRKDASTLLVHRIGFLEDLSVATATAVAEPPVV